MNLSEPLDGLMSAVDAAVLRVLSRTDAGLSGRQVHAVAGVGSTSSVHRSLVNLVGLGLVRAEARPPAIVYRPNREHVLWDVVTLALGARDRAILRIREFFNEEVPEEVPSDRRLAAVLYGSVARRSSRADSDVDILVVFPDDFDLDAQADFSYRLAEFVERLTGNSAQVNAMRREEYLDRLSSDDPFLGNVRHDGIHLYGDLPSLTSKVV